MADKEILGTPDKTRKGTTMEIAASLHNLAYVAHNEGDDTRAAQLFEESLAQHCELGNREGMTECLAGLAMLAATRGQLEAAARLFGAVEALREAIGALAWLAGRTECERHASLVRTQLDARTFVAVRAEGQAMMLEQAVAYALGTTSPHGYTLVGGDRTEKVVQSGRREGVGTGLGDGV
jgi:hypothetical protein